MCSTNWAMDTLSRNGLNSNQRHPELRSGALPTELPFHWMIWLNCKFITLLASHLPETLYLSYKSFPHSYHFSWEVMESNHPMRKATWFLTHHFTMTNFRCWSLDYVITMHFCLGVRSIVCTHLEVFQLHLARRHRAFSKHSIHRISQIFQSQHFCWMLQYFSQSGPLPTTV